MKVAFLNKTFEIEFWADQQLGNVIAIDTETTMVPFTDTPDLITFQAFDGNRLFYVRETDVQKFMGQHGESNLVFHNAPFDVDVICKHLDDKNYFDKWVQHNRLWDTQMLYKLLKLATQGSVPYKSSLALVTKELFNEELNKDVEIRTNFQEYHGIALEQMPDHFLAYGALDVLATFFVFHSLRASINSTGSSTQLSHQIQIAGAIALNRTYKNGIGFDLDKAQSLLADLNSQISLQRDILALYGWSRGFKGSKEAYERVVGQHLDLPLPRTEDGSISSKAEDLLPYRSHQFVDSYLKFIELEKESTFIRDLNNEKIHPRYNYLVNTGRTSCSKPNFQQLPREGEIRNCFVSNNNAVFIITDYSAIELCSLAQVTYSRYGHSKMRELINEGRDLHRYYASVLHGITEEEVTKQQRQEAKAANFGFPGGLGIETFIKFSHGYGLTLSIDKAQQMKDAWFRAFPEVQEYLNEQEPDESTWTLTGRKRAQASYCARKNTPFQGLAADGAKLALYNLDLQGFTLRGFVHDEIITEVASGSAEVLKQVQEDIMINSMSIVIPDVKIAVESQISDRYCK